MGRARILVRLTLLAAALLAPLTRLGSAGADPALAPPNAPFSEFRVLTPGERRSLHFKLTRLGSADPANAVAVWSVEGQLAKPGEFAPYRRPGYSYEPDNTLPFVFSIEADQVQAVIDSVGSLPQVVRGAAESRGVLSFAMLIEAGGATRAFEAIVGEEEARILMGRLLDALRGNRSAVQSLRRFGCAGDLLPEGVPAAVDSLLKISLTVLKPDKASPGEFLASAVITNQSSVAIAGPLTLLIELDSNTRWIGAEGVTCRLQPAGTPFIDFGEAALEPGGAIRQSLRFWNPSGHKFDPVLRVVAGPGTR